MKRKVSISTFRLQEKFGDREALAIAKRIGADAVDFNTCDAPYDFQNPQSIYSKSDEEIYEYFRGLKKYADELGVEIGQTHGRITGYKNIPEEDEAFLKNARLDCIAANALEARACIIHNVTTIFLGPDAAPELMHDVNFRMFDDILKYAKQYNVKLATETFGDSPPHGCCDFFGNIKEFTKAYDRICAEGDNAKYMSTCVDVGHSNKATKYNNPTPADVIRILGSSISTLHLHDNDTIVDQHKMPLTGTIDWNDVFNALDEVNYDGNYNMEIVLGHFGDNLIVDEAEFAIKVMKEMLHSRYGA